MEHDAWRVREFQLGFIPGQLQRARYMRDVFAGTTIQRSRKWVENDIAVRKRRQQRLVGDDPLEYHAVISEAALRSADREQLRHLVETGRLPNVTIQVLLEAAGLHDGQLGSFTLLDLPFAGDPHVLYIEHVAGSFHIEDPDRVKTANLVFQHLSKLALTPRRVRRVDREVGFREVDMWRKSSRSGGGSNANCVEVALNGSAVRVRDSKNRQGSAASLPDRATFIGAVKRGEFEKS